MEYLLLWVMGIWIGLMLPFFGAFVLVVITDPEWRKTGRRRRKHLILNCAGAASVWPWFVPWALYHILRN